MSQTMWGKIRFLVTNEPNYSQLELGWRDRPRATKELEN